MTAYYHRSRWQAWRELHTLTTQNASATVHGDEPAPARAREQSEIIVAS